MRIGRGGASLKLPIFWLLLLWTASAATHGLAANISSKTVYFTVSGTTLGEVLRSILANGPGGHSGLAMATTQTRISQSVNTKKKGKCRPTTKALIITHMPRLSKSSRKVPAVRAQWGKFIRYVNAMRSDTNQPTLAAQKRSSVLMRASFRKHGCKNARSRVNTIIQAEMPAARD